MPNVHFQITMTCLAMHHAVRLLLEGDDEAEYPLPGEKIKECKERDVCCLMPVVTHTSGPIKMVYDVMAEDDDQTLTLYFEAASDDVLKECVRTLVERLDKRAETAAASVDAQKHEEKRGWRLMRATLALDDASVERMLAAAPR